MDNNGTSLQKTSVRILEDWAMMMVEPLSNSQGNLIFDLNEPLYMSWVNMRGSKKGTLTIVAQKNFIQTLTANLLGEQKEISEEEAKDAFKEMGNVLAGNFFTEAYGENTVFDLIYPNVVQIEPKQLEKLEQRSTSFYYNADDAPIMFTFSIDEK